MLSRALRMRSSSEFATVIKGGRRAAAPSLVVHALPTGETRVGFVVSKAVGNAVVRNRVRRRLSEVVRANLTMIDGQALVLRALPVAASSSSMELTEAFTRCVKKVAP